MTINNSGKMECDCGSIHRNGIPDRHIAHVAIKFGKDFESFTHHDVDPRFWMSYCKFVAVDDPSQMDAEKLKLRADLIKARQEMNGFPSAPSFQELDKLTYVAGMKSEEMFLRYSVEEAKQHFELMKAKGSAVLNYADNDVEAALMAEYNVDHAAGMTQETYNCESEQVDHSISFPEGGAGPC